MAKEQGKPTPQTEDVFGGSEPIKASKEKSIEKTEVATKEEAPKKVRYHSRRARLGFTIRTKNIVRDGQGRVVREDLGKRIQFRDNQLETDDPEVIDWLDKYIASPNTSTDEVFRMPEVDELIAGDMVGRIDSMELDELRAACRQRDIEFRTTDVETELRYKLLKHLSFTK